MNSLKLAALVASCTAATLVGTSAQADTIFGVYAGAGSWQTDYSGDVGQPAIGAKDLGIKDNNNTYYYIALEHPIPLLPNIRLQHENISRSQSATINQSFEIDGTEFDADTQVDSAFDLSYNQGTLYYEVLDNWFNLDLGLTLRKYSGYVRANSDFANAKVDADQTVPLVYGKFQFDLPFSGLSAGIEGNYVKYQDSTLSDYSAKISYLFDSVLDAGVELGYRSMTINLDDNDVQTNLELTGPYAAAIFHF